MRPGHGARPVLYAYTLPGRCDGKLVLDGRHWLSSLPPPADVPDIDVWAYVKPGGNIAGFIAPAGAVEFEPDNGQRTPACRA